MPKIDSALEIKFCGNLNREKSIIPEINDDILAYQTKYRNIFFVVYDICTKHLSGLTESPR
jgi:hypothetical protein